MFSANKITGMTVVLSETLKEIIHKGDVSQDNHPYSIFNCKKPNIVYVAQKPWEHVQKGEKPPDCGLYPNSGYTGHVPGAREVHGGSFQSSIKLAQRTTLSQTIRDGDHYADGGHFKSSAELGSLSGGKLPSLPPSARASARDQRLTERRSARQSQRGGPPATGPAHGDILAQEPIASARSTARSREPLGSARSTASTARSRRSGMGATNRSRGTGREAQVKALFEELPPSRREAIVQELSSGWIQNK